MTLNDYFDKIYCINLDRRTDRWESAQKEFEKHGIVVDRISAVEGGAQGLIETNKRIFRNAIVKGYNSILILEDDVEFIEDLQNKFKEAYSSVPENWNMLYFGGNHFFGQPVPINNHVAIPKNTLSSHAIAYKKDAYQKMLDKLVLNEPMDITFANNLIYFDAFLFFPHLAWQKSGHSDIENQYVDYSFLR
jgi:GR25 family glycosyltransferase involved in LPS biosynthesis